MSSNAEEAVDRILDYGTKSPQRIVDAARVLPELARRLNHVTLDYQLTDPADVNSITHAVREMVERLPQLLQQLAGHVNAMTNIGTSSGDAGTTTGLACRTLRLSAAELANTVEVLKVAARWTDELYLDQDDERL